MSTLGEQWMQEGLRKGLQQGLEQGLERGRKETAAMMTLRQLQHRFGNLNIEVQVDIKALSFEKLEGLSDALLDFNSVEELTTWLATHS